MALPYLNLSLSEKPDESALVQWIRSNGLHSDALVEELMPKIETILDRPSHEGTIETADGIEFKIQLVDGTPQLYFDIAKSNMLIRKSQEELDALRVYSQALNHDIATPLQNIALQIELMSIKGHEDENVFQNCISGIRESIFASQNIVKDLSDFAKLTVSSDERCDVNEVIMHVKKLLQDEIEDSNAAIAHGAFTDLKIQPFRMLIIFKNLIQNAIKYAGPYKPQILIFETREEGKHIITVQDSGIGIPREDQSKIFAPYNRASNVGNIKGTGIGLSTCRSLLRGAGGEVVFESPLSRVHTQPGTAFHLEFPDALVYE